MFQTYDEPAEPQHADARVGQLRDRFDALGIDGFLVPRADEFQGEYVPAAAERLRWLTGFTGSAGVALILHEQAILFVDGRYTLQAQSQTDGAIFSHENLVTNPPARWLKDQGAKGLRLGFDPWLHTIREAETLRAALAEIGGELLALDENPVDAIWHERPEPPLGRISLQPEQLAGVGAAQKLAELSEELRGNGVSHQVLSDPAAMAWAFNLRGKDVPHTPLALGYAILAADGTHALYLDADKLEPSDRTALGKLARLASPAEFRGDLTRLAAAEARIGLDPAHASEKLYRLAGKAAVLNADPVSRRRAIKNAAEIEGARNAQRRDGIAVTRFLHWLDTMAPGTVDEISAARKLEEMRRIVGNETGMPLEDISFDTISGAGPNGAIIHYRVTTATNRQLEPGSLYLVDSGGQYRDGTTDITRTIAIGEPSAEMRRHYTIVLKGLIAISTLRFPAGTRGADIDAIARIAHWQAGIDYAHGTGHGVGSYLSVHEGPQRISRTGTEQLVAGMILSNEPGYYREGEYGIRLENLILVEGPEEVKGGDTPMLGFETLTLAPFDRRLIDAETLTPAERHWLDAYHERVACEVGPLLDDATQGWLRDRCAPVSA